MGEVNSPVSKTARLLDLVPYLLSHQNISLSDLSSEFGVSQKEMIEDLNTLWMCGLPGYTPLELIDLSFESGIVSISNADVLKDVRSLSFEEVMALLLGLDILKASLPSGSIEVDRVIAKLKSKAQEIVGEVVMFSSSSMTPLASLVKSAIAERREIAFTYRSSSAEISSRRRAVPLEFVTRQGIDYLESYCLDSQGFRTFRCDRIVGLSLGQARTEPVSGAAPSQGQSGKLRIHRDPRGAVERFSLEIDVAPLDPGILHHLTYFNHEWIERAVLASAGDVECAEPKAVREGVQARAMRALQAYQ